MSIKILINLRKPDSKKDIKNKLELALNQVSSFYQIDMNSLTIHLNLIYSREEFNKKINQETPNWLVGFTDKNQINLLSPSVINKYSPHSPDYFEKILTHELSHIFASQINEKPLMWLDEGLALNIAGQKKKNEIPKSDWNFFIAKGGLVGNMSFNDFSRYSGYRISFWMAKTLLDNFDQKTILKLLQIKPTQKNIEKQIEKIITIPIKEFISLNKKSLCLI